MKELGEEVSSILNSMNVYSRKLALSNLYNRDYDITPYINDLIDRSNENLRSNGFIKTSNPHKDVIVYEIKKAGKFVFKEEKDKKYKLIVNPIRKLV